MQPGLNWYVMADTGMRYVENTIPEPEKEPLLLDERIRMVPRSVYIFKVRKKNCFLNKKVIDNTLNL